LDGHTYAQSGALYRVVARKAKLEGSSDHEFCLNQMLIEEYQDIWSAISKPQYIEDGAARANAWTELLTKTLPTHLGFLEKLVGANGQFSPNNLLVGDVLMICLFQVLVEVADNAKCLDSFPKLLSFFNKNRDVVLSADDLKLWPYIVRK
jgi:hypothetical protein